jgi:hypothetical protein
MEQTSNKRCPPELLMFCRRELSRVKVQIDWCLEHLAEGETLSALGAFDGMEERLPSLVAVVRLLAQLYPKSANNPRLRDKT